MCMIKITKKREKLFCDNCNEYTDYKVIKRQERIEIKDETISTESKIAICKSCGNELFEPYLENENLKQVYREYARRKNLVLPDEIKKIRKKYGVSQKLFAIILGVGKATIERYETGAIPSSLISELIKKSKEPQFFLDLLEKNKENISRSDYKEIKSRVQRFINEKNPVKEMTKKITEIIMGPIEDIDKLVGIITEILLSLRNKGFEYSYQTKLYKMMWFVEDEYKNSYGKPLLPINFAHAPNGPIPNIGIVNINKGYRYLLSYLEERGAVEIITNEEIINGKPKETTKIVLKDESMTKYISEDEKEIVKNVVEKYGHLTGKKLSDISHEDARYKNTKDGDPIE